jgi:hypothetical protein
LPFEASLGKIVHETLSRKNPSQKWTGGMDQGVGLEFKPQFCKQQQQNPKSADSQFLKGVHELADYVQKVYGNGSNPKIEPVVRVELHGGTLA